MKPLSRLQSARYILESYADYSPVEIGRLPKKERELYEAARQYILGRTPRKVSKVQSSVARRKTGTKPRTAKRTPSETKRRIQQIRESVAPKPKPRKRTPSKLVEYFRGSKPRRYPRKTDPLFQSMYEHMDDLEELLDEDNAEEAEIEGKSDGIWYEKSHSVYTQGKKIVSKIEKRKKKWQTKKTTKSTTAKGKLSTSGKSYKVLSKRKRKHTRKRKTS